jgi:hypothetical protein
MCAGRTTTRQRYATALLARIRAGQIVRTARHRCMQALARSRARGPATNERRASGRHSRGDGEDDDDELPLSGRPCRCPPRWPARRPRGHLCRSAPVGRTHIPAETSAHQQLRSRAVRSARLICPAAFVLNGAALAQVAPWPHVPTFFCPTFSARCRT